MNLDLYRHIYLVGIGGIGMSALARYFNAKGKSVCGYDQVRSSLCVELEKEGIDIYYADEASSKAPSATCAIENTTEAILTDKYKPYN